MSSFNSIFGIQPEGLPVTCELVEKMEDLLKGTDDEKFAAARAIMFLKRYEESRKDVQDLISDDLKEFVHVYQPDRPSETEEFETQRFFDYLETTAKVLEQFVRSIVTEKTFDVDLNTFLRIDFLRNQIQELIQNGDRVPSNLLREMADLQEQAD